MEKQLKLAWLAGIWDGEGSITIFRHKERNGSLKLKPCLVLTNTDESIINEAVKILDSYDIRFHIIDYTRPKSKRIYQLTTSKLSNLEKFCEIMIPYLIGKKSQAELLLRYAKLRNDKIKLAGNNKHAVKYDDEEFALQIELQSLNHRGESSETKHLTPKGEDIVRSL